MKGSISSLLRELTAPPGEAGAASTWEGVLAPGAVFGRFELVQEVGRGGFGDVWEARDLELGRTVAFKALRVAGAGDVREERLLREAEAAARLSHPNIVTLHDVGRTEHEVRPVLELLRGETLARRLERGPLAAADAVRVALEVARGLAHAHAEGVVHRDLTAGNVFLCADGRVKLLDLGLAHAFGRRRVEGGTPAAMAPEQWRGAPEDERTDVFAWGALAHRMLAGSAPFPDDGGRSLLAGTAPPRLEVPPAPGLGELVARALERDPVDRPRDGAELLAALEAIREAVPRAPQRERSVRVRHPRGRWRTALLVALGVATGAALALVAASRHLPSHGVRAASIAVLPFADMSPARDQEYFADGLSEAILEALTRVEGLRVAGRTSSFAFKGRNEDLRSIGQKLGVAHVLEGSVRKAGNRLRITAQVVDIATGFHVWSSTFDRELSDVFAVQDEIARAVVAHFRMNAAAASATARQLRTPDPEVYRQYLLARSHYASFSPEGFRKAVAAYRRALALDPGYAPAWGGVAIPLLYTCEDEKDPVRRKAIQAEAAEAADQAIALDPDLAEGYTARGYIRDTYRWDWEGAEADFQKALALAPSDATTLRRYGLHQAAMGREDEAVSWGRRAAELDPIFPANWAALGSAYLVRGELGPARAAIQRARELAPSYVTDGKEGVLLLLEGHPAEALAMFERTKDEEERTFGVPAALHALGRRAEARDAIAEAERRFGEDKPFDLAQIHALAGDPDAAFAWLERAFARRDEMLGNIRASPFLKPLRGDPRYAALLRRMGMPSS
ncbi:MAG TPA: protein kinase [Anaeromyxobacteraceae bacterium]|nr:protein kinase [Anaeromyxobacteraceae bacterium]